MTRTSPSPGWSVSGIAGSVCPDRRKANTLVFAVLIVRPIEEQVESNDLNISSRSLLESARNTVSSAYATLLRRSSLVNFSVHPLAFVHQGGTVEEGHSAGGSIMITW